MTQPTDVSGLVGWFKADGTLWQDTARSVGATADGDPVGSWDDASGSNNHAQQGTAGNRPLYKTSIQNGRPVIRFDGSNDLLVLLSNFTVGPSSVLAVVKGTNVASYSGIFVADKIGVYNAGAGGNEWGVYTNLFDYSTQNVYSGFRQISAVIRAANDIDLVTDGVTLVHATDGSSYQARGSTAIGADPSGIQNSALDVCELLVYNVAITTPQRQGLEAYLRDKWNTAGAGSLATEVLADMPAVFWKLDGANMTAALTDASGNGRNGSVNGTINNPGPDQTSIITTTAEKSLGLDGTGSSNYSKRAYESGLDVGTGDFAYEWWQISTNSTANWVQVCGRDGTDNGYQACYFHITSGVGRLYIGGTPFDGTISLTDSALHHVVMQRVSGHGQIWVDGTLDVDQSGMTGNTDHSEDLHLGVLGGAYTTFKGNIQYFAYYTHSLDSTRIAAHYNAGVGASPNTVTMGGTGAVAVAGTLKKLGVVTMAATAALNITVIGGGSGGSGTSLGMAPGVITLGRSS